MTISQYLKLLVVLCLTLILAVVASSVKQSAIQTDSFKQLKSIMLLELKIDALRSNFWLLQHYNDIQSFDNTQRLQIELATALSDMSSPLINQQQLLQELISMNNNIGKLLKVSREQINNSTATGMTSTSVMLQARLNMIIQSMGDALYVFQLEAIKQMDKKQHDLQYVIGIFLLIIALILMGLTTMTLTRFRRSVTTLNQGIQDLANGDLTSQLPCLYQDEFHQLFDQFNAMKAMLIVSHQQTQSLQSEIETQNLTLIEQQTKLQHLADHDELTGLYSRYAFKQHVHKALELCARNHHSAAILFVDVNNFKPINDTLGHGVGDKVLIEIAKRLIQVVRRTDMVARLGGDEFLIWLNPLQQNDEVMTVVNKLASAIATPIIVEGNSLTLTASIGSALYPTDGTTLDRLIHIADANMYLEKAHTSKLA